MEIVMPEKPAIDGRIPPLTNRDLLKVLQGLPEERLDDAVRYWAMDPDGTGLTFYSVARLEEDYVDPNDDGWAPVSYHKEEAWIIDEAPRLPKGQLILLS